MTARLTENDIRPADLFAAYLELVALDVDAFFSDTDRRPMACPACDNAGEPAFAKLGFEYRECPDCHSLWVSPRPAFSHFSDFYSKSPSSKYWADVFSPAVMEVRRERLWRPKARRIAELAATWGTPVTPFRSLVDIGGGTGVFAEEFAAVNDMTTVVVEPSPEAAQACRSRGINVIQSFLEDLDPAQLPEGPHVFTCFELFEHVHDPVTWLRAMADLMRPGDLLVLTTLSSTGLDIRVLWEQSASINPPHHINFLNPGAMRQLADRCGLTLLDVTTPGQLDVDILRNNMDKISDRFWRLLVQSDVATRTRWQSVVAETGNSSHLWAVMSKAT